MCASELFRRNGRFGQDPRPAQDLADRKGPRVPDDLGHCGRRLREFAGTRQIHGETRRIGRRTGERNPAFDLAALQFRENSLPQRGFEPAQFVRQTNLEVEEPVVDGTQFDGQRHTGQLRGNCREAGHAEDHCRNTPDSRNFSGFTLGAFIRRMYALSATRASTRSPIGMRIASEFRG